MPAPIRAPWPYDVIIGGRGYLLGALDKTGAQMIATKPADLAQQTPSDLGYDAQPPQVARTQSYDDLSGGFGQRIQLQTHDKRYHYALGVDAARGTPWVLGPLLNNQTRLTYGSVAEISTLFELGGKLYAANGHWILRRNDDTATGWDGVLDLGTGTATDAISFYNAGNGAATAYIALGSSDFIWKYDGVTGTKHASLYAQSFAVVGREFWRGVLPNQLSKCDIDADPWTAGNWTVANTYTVGEKSGTISRVASTVSNTLLALKTEGIFTLDSDGNDINLYPNMKFGASSSNGRAFGEFLNALYTSYDSQTFRITPTPVLGGGNPHLPEELIGPERIVDNASEVHGRLTAFAGHDAYALYAAMYNEDTGNSYLLKFGSWIEGPDGAPVRAEVWHGSLTPAMRGKKVTAMHVTSIGAASLHKRLYLGFDDGTISWFALPCTPNPVNCTEYQYQTTTGTVTFPWFHAGYRNDTKVLSSVTVAGMNLEPTNYANVQVSVSPDVAFQYLVDSDNLPYNFTTTPLQTVPIGANSIAFAGGALAALEKYSLADLEAFTLAELEVLESSRAGYSGRYLGMTVSLTSTDSGTPEVMGASFEYQVRLKPKLIYQFNVLADQTLTKRDATPYRSNAPTILAAMESLRDATTPVAVTLPDQTSTNLSVIGYTQTQVWSERLHKWFGGVQIQAVEFPTPAASSTPLYGTLLRLEPYTLAELEAFTLNQMEAL